MEHIFKNNGKIYQDPVFNPKKGRVCERFFCEGRYDELFNFNKEIYEITKKNPDIKKHLSVYRYNWEEEFVNDSKNMNNFDLYLKYSEILFTRESFSKLSKIFEKDDHITFFIFSKINEFTDECNNQNSSDKNEEHPYMTNNYNYFEEETINMNSKAYYELGSMFIDYIVKYNCSNTLVNILGFRPIDFYEQCYESWENFFINGAPQLVCKILKFRPDIFNSVKKSVISRVIENDEDTPFLKNVFTYYNVLGSYKILGFRRSIYQNDLDLILKIFNSVIINSNKIMASDPVYEIILTAIVSSKTEFKKIVDAIKLIRKYDTLMHFKTNIDLKNVKNLHKYADIDEETIFESLRYISAMVSMKN